MGFFKTCPYCGCHLDPNERCDCIEDKPGKNERRKEHENDGQKAQPEAAQKAGAEMPRNLHPVRD